MNCLIYLAYIRNLEPFSTFEIGLLPHPMFREALFIRMKFPSDLTILCTVEMALNDKGFYSIGYHAWFLICERY